MMFCASWVFGPAAGPNGVSTFSSKIGSAPAGSACTILRTPKMEPVCSCSVMTQFIRLANGMGLMMSLIVYIPSIFSRQIAAAWGRRAPPRCVPGG